ncbi:MAG: polysaccharide biosynthesis tyrosine autokinase [Micavibrio sp.]
MDRRRTDRRRPDAQGENTIDIKALLYILWKRRIILTAFFIAFLTPAFLYVLLKPAYYKATATVLLDNQDIRIGDFTDAIPPQKIETADVDTQVRIITSPSLVRETIASMEENGEEPESVDGEQSFKNLRGFLANLSVASQGRSRIIAISYKSTDPFLAAETANAHARQYIAFQLRERRERLLQIDRWITEQIASLKEESKRKAEATQDYRRSSGIIPGKNSEDLINQQILDLTAQLIPVETRKLSLQARTDALSAANDPAGQESAALLGQLKIKQSEAKQNLEAMKAQYGTLHPLYIASLNRYKQASADLQRENKNARDSLRSELSSVSQQEEMLRTRLQELNRELDSYRGNLVALESLEAEEAANRTLLESFLKRSEEIRSQLSLDRSGARIDSGAETPTSPDGITKPVLLLLALILAASAAIFTVFMLELIDRGIEDENDIKRFLNLPLIASVPHVAAPLAEIGSDRKSPFLEAIKRLYLSLSAQPAPQAILITSACEHEGKTTIARAFVKYTATLGKKVLLIETAFGSGIQAQRPGLGEALTNPQTASEYIQPVSENFFLLPSGKKQPEFMAGNRLENLIGLFKEQYDYIVFDGSSVEDSTDSEIIAAQSDNVVLVIGWAQAKREALIKTANILRQYARNTPLVVLNKRP